MKDPKLALKAIERLVGSDFGFEMDLFLHEKPVKDTEWLTKTLRHAAEIIGQVYVIAHSEGDCTGHPEWEAVKEKILAEAEV